MPGTVLKGLPRAVDGVLKMIFVSFSGNLISLVFHVGLQRPISSTSGRFLVDVSYVPSWRLLVSMRGQSGRCDWRFADVLGAVNNLSDEAEF